MVGYDTRVTELGIASPPVTVRESSTSAPNRDPTATGTGNDVIHPAHLPVARRDEICARCHGALVPKASMWDPSTHRDPFVPGQELTLYNTFFWSEEEQARLAGVRRPTAQAAPIDGRFWGDGTPLTTALEYNGMASRPVTRRAREN